MENNVVNFPTLGNSKFDQEAAQLIAQAIVEADRLDRELKARRLQCAPANCNQNMSSALETTDLQQSRLGMADESSVWSKCSRLGKFAKQSFGIGLLITAFILLYVDWSGMNAIVPHFNLISSCLLAGVSVTAYYLHAKRLFDF